MSSARRTQALIGAMIGALAGCGDNFAVRDAPVVDVAAPSIDAILATAGDAPDRPDAALVDASPFDAAPGVPDLQFVANQMAGTVVFDRHTFYADDCEVVEQCVGGAGARLLLRFDTVTANRGTGDLVVGVPPPDGESNDQFVWSECHKHHHYNNFIQYQLIDSAGTVTAARKQAFCLEDGEQVQIGAAPTGYSCRNQGISRGWADVYTRYTPCQWIDVTGLPSGAYTLHAEVNPLHTLVESSYDNNVFTVAVKL
jgi:hypothetical protein